MFVYTCWLCRCGLLRNARPARLGRPVARPLVLAQVGLGIANVKLSLPLHVAVRTTRARRLLLFVLVTLLARVRAPD